MARQTDLGGTFRPIWIWDIDRKVGYGASSTKPDVMLVQLFLNKVVRVLDLRDERKAFNNGPNDPLQNRVHGYPLLGFLKVDGACGNETAYAIGQYQKKRSGSGDSAVDPIHPLLSGGVPKIIFRTMYQLNVDVLRITGKMLDEKEFPAELKADVNRRRAR